MKDGFRQSMAWLHTWTGLLLGWVLFFIFLTGTAGYFDTEIDRWMRPEFPPPASQVQTVKMLERAVERLQAKAPNAERWRVSLPTDHGVVGLNVSWRGSGHDAAAANGSEQLDQNSGEPLKPRATGGGQLLYRMHYRLHYLPTTISYWLVGIAAMFMLVAILTGIIVHRKFFVDFFTFRQRKGQRSWLDAHNVLAVMALPFHVMITYSGLIFFAYLYMAPVIAATYGFGENSQRLYFDELEGRLARPARANTQVPLTPLAPLIAEAEAQWGEGRVRSLEILYPGDSQAQVSISQTPSGPLRRTATMVFNGVSGALIEVKPAIRSTPKAIRDTLLGLHEGLFAGPVLRWLYFLSGSIGTAMIATGLVLWTVKRREKLKRTGEPSFGLLLVERLNIGTVVGLPIAIAAYFWANRLIPAGVEGRAAWEAHAMFIAWTGMLLHPIFRPVQRAWIEQCWLATAVFGLLPMLNALTTNRHLAASLAQGDWVLAGFDLTMLAFGAAFGCTAWMLSRRARDRVTRHETLLSFAACKNAEPAE
ncbi:MULTISPECIES: PepSY domain-containing protein [unclassified Nitrobacter]|uniref:PepSY-associated TM helix domain-containing protein n=1 Tax=unclassified Nitrobacter TaxID=2620411 RepID=UPI00092650F1|nr:MULTISPECIES: PepSY-associated TM helix domain-containing protein [unclassified Nitrobacter]MBN9147939.1 PepSY domain-containing protein [Nitrobacter sp.]MBN9489899.1 PepSY domain-containing protein [Alphaproteobacteria bacterium]OJV01429.1 MAG: hypothetical protein BGO16_12790 [Nitrobacter sp. 62-23]